MLTTERLPHLIETRLDEADVPLFQKPMVWEVVDQTDTVIYEGLIDFKSQDDRRALGQLADYCYRNDYMLCTYKSGGAFERRR